MSIRMIAIDLDGTLLHDDMTISAYTREVIQKAIQKGYEIVVATGRMWDSARSKVSLLRLGNVPVICYTGAWIMWSETGEPILQDGLSADLASRVMLAAKERGWEATAFWDNHIYMEKPNGSEAKCAGGTSFVHGSENSPAAAGRECHSARPFRCRTR